MVAALLFYIVAKEVVKCISVAVAYGARGEKENGIVHFQNV